MWNPFKSLKKAATSQFVKSFVLSKRNVGVIVSAVVIYLNHRGVIVPDKVQADMVDQFTVLAGMAWTLATKAIDVAQAEKKAIDQANKQ